MADMNRSMEELAGLVMPHAPVNGLNPTAMASLAVFRESAPHCLRPQMYDPCIIFIAQGRSRSMS